MMKTIIYITLFLTLTLACKNDSMDVMNAGNFNALAGKWYLKEYERSTVDNSSVWEPVKAPQGDTLIFRGDGVLLGTNGLPVCCPPKALTVNGELMDIIPKGDLPPNPICASVNCFYCPLWEITLQGNELIVKSCLAQRAKYVR